MTTHDDSDTQNLCIDDAEQLDRALQLAILQIDMSLRESGQSVEAMNDAITSLAADLHRIRNLIDTASSKGKIQEICDQAEQHIHGSITAFQFYDRMSQRFTHIMENLREICSVIDTPIREHASQWKNLQERMRTVYSLEQEQIMYRALIDGIPFDDPDIPDSNSSRQAAGEIELF